MAHILNSMSSQFVSKVTMENSGFNNVSGNFVNNLRLEIPQILLLRGLMPVRTNYDQVDDQLNLWDKGKFQLSVNGAYYAGTYLSAGELHVEYTVKLSKPKQLSPVRFAPAYIQMVANFKPLIGGMTAVNTSLAIVSCTTGASVYKSNGVWYLKVFVNNTYGGVTTWWRL